MTEKELAKRKERAEKANEFLRTIASCGRQFFNHKEVSRFEVAPRVWFIDGYYGKRMTVRKGWGRRFAQGGTLKILIESLKEYIMTGSTIHSGQLGPWPQTICNGDLWGYGEDIKIVRAKAEELGITYRPANK